MGGGGGGGGGSLPDLITRFFTGKWNERKLTTSLTKTICSLRWRITGFPLRPVKKEGKNTFFCTCDEDPVASKLCVPLLLCSWVPAPVCACVGFLSLCVPLLLSPWVPPPVCACVGFFSLCVPLLLSPWVPPPVCACVGFFSLCVPLLLSPWVPPPVCACVGFFSLCVPLLSCWPNLIWAS